MTEQYFVHLREEQWNKFESLLKSGRKEFKKNAPDFLVMLRTITGDLNTAKASAFDPVIVERLNRLVLDGNQYVGVQAFSLISFVEFITKTFPRALRFHWRSFAACSFLFYSVYFVSALLCIYNPDFTDRIIGAESKFDLSKMYDKNNEYYLKPREIPGDADMFGFYVYNNISIAFRGFASGLICGVGSLFVLIFNAFFLGGATGHLINEGFAETFFSFTATHSPFELTGIVLSATAGLLLGYSLFVTKGLSRTASLKRAGQTVFPLISGSAILIFIAAIIEAFWSSRHEINPVVRLSTGVSCWILLYVYFIFCGRKKNDKKRIAQNEYSV
jgi:uncharacterized membrane protein SpoIIM required for sporulation